MARLDGAGAAPLGIVRGNAFRDTVTIKDVDWTARSFEAALRATPFNGNGGAPAPLATFGVAVALVGGSTVLTLSLTEAQVDALPSVTPAGADLALFWDLKHTSAGVRRTLIYGRATVFGSATF